MTTHSAREYHVLVAEDHPIEQKLLVAALGSAGYTTKLAENGEQALIHLEIADFDLIIIDSHMPILSGAEAMKAIRSRPDWKRHIPILLLAEDIGAAQQDQALAQANISLTKPLDIARFISAASGLAKAGRAFRHSSAGGGAILKRPGSAIEDHRLILGYSHLGGIKTRF